MNPHKIAALLALAMLLGLLAGCGQAEKPPKTEDNGPISLTEAEIQQVNEAFEAYSVRDNWCFSNSLCCFLTSYYERPEDLDLTEFLRYFSIEKKQEKTPQNTPEEMEALSHAAGWPFGDITDIHALPEPVRKYPREEVDNFLLAHAGITTEDLTEVNTGTADLMYLEETDAYYNLTSDMGLPCFFCVSGKREGDTVTLTGDRSELTLKQQPDGNWYFVSYLPLDETGVAIMPERADPNALTAEEIEQVNEVFAATYTEGNVSYATQISCFFTSYYEKPEEINFREFMYLFSPGEVLPDDSEELQALARLEGWPFSGEFEPDFLPMPTHKFQRADVDAALQTYMGITTADLTHVNDNGPTLLYLEEYDAYYNFTSDFGPGTFRCVSGRRDGDRVILTGDRAELVLEQQADGNWYFVSYLPLKAEE